MTARYRVLKPVSLSAFQIGADIRPQLSAISRSVLLCVAMSVRSSAGFGILRWRRSQPGIPPRPDTCQARAESFPHAAVRGNTPDPLPERFPHFRDRRDYS